MGNDGRCSVPLCRVEPYWILDDERMYCTVVHMRDDVGDFDWTAAKEINGMRRIIRRAKKR